MSLPVVPRVVLPVVTALAFAFGCGADGKKSDEPTTAKEKQEREARAMGESDAPKGKHWGKWRYKGDRNSCFFRVGARCFKTENAACQAARCKKPKKCHTEGAAPAQVSCK